MNLRSKKLIIPTAAVAAALVVGGTAWAASGDDVDGTDRDRAEAAALAEVGEGTITDVDAADDRDDPAFEVEVTRRDGSEVDVALGPDFSVLYVDDERGIGSAPAATDEAPAATESTPAPSSVTPRISDDEPLSGAVKRKAEAAAIKAVGGGEALKSERDADDDGDRAIYEVDVRATDGTYWKVELDRSYSVVEKEIED